MNSDIEIQNSSLSTKAGAIFGSATAKSPAQTFAGRTAEDFVATAGKALVPFRFEDPAGRLEGKLFDSKAAFKIAFASIAMHFPAEWRERFFRQVDRLLDSEEWDPDDLPVRPESSLSFLRMIVFLRPDKPPSLGATDDGNLVAAWTKGESRLTIICGPNDHVRWVISQNVDGERETAAGSTSVKRLPINLQAYNPSQWFGNARR